MTRLWVDDLRPAPTGYDWARSVNEAKNFIEYYMTPSYELKAPITFMGKPLLLDLDNDLGDWFSDGGDAINLIGWLETKQAFDDWNIKDNIIFRFHTMNIVARETMKRAIKANGWKLVNADVY